MARPKKLVCDRCGAEVNDGDAIELAFQGTAAWHTFVKGKGEIPRGIFACQNYVRCGGEMIDPKDKSKNNGHKPS